MKIHSPSIYITSNAGVIIENLGKTILIDSLFRVDKICPWPVERISEELEERIINGTGIFQCIEALVFTHCHPDHFDEKLLIRCIENKNIRNLILPRDNKYFDEKSVMAICNRNNCKLIFLERE
nr:hypothetical protein [uncultured Acetobacterium sp.]